MTDELSDEAIKKWAASRKRDALDDWLERASSPSHKYPEYMGLPENEICDAIQSVASRRHHYRDANSRLVFLACELARKISY